MTDRAAQMALRRFGLRGEEIARLERFAQEDDQTLAELVAFVLRDYAPATFWRTADDD